MIDVVCDSCGKTTAFADEMKGNVEVCPQCGDFLDVGEVEWDEADYAGFDHEQADEPEDPSPSGDNLGDKPQGLETERTNDGS